MRAALALALAGCASPVPPSTEYAWKRESDPREVLVVKVASPLAGEFCSAFLGAPVKACAVRLDAQRRCVIVVTGDDPHADAHEAAHCLGWGHP